MSSKPRWGKHATNSEADGRFSQLDEMDDLRPLGHGVQISTGMKAGDGAGDEGVEGELAETEMGLPSRRIKVKTDVVVETSERLIYNDRLY